MYPPVPTAIDPQVPSELQPSAPESDETARRVHMAMRVGTAFMPKHTRRRPDASSPLSPQSRVPERCLMLFATWTV